MAPSGSMRVVAYHKPGDSSVLQIEQRPVPKRGDGEVLIKQYGTSVNPVDYKMRSSNKDHLPKASLHSRHQILGMHALLNACPCWRLRRLRRLRALCAND